MSCPRIFADFHNADEQGRLRLNCVGTIEDLSRENIKLQNGQLLNVSSMEFDCHTERLTLTAKPQAVS